MKKTHRSRIGLLVLAFFLVCAISTPSEYIHCQRLSPDENLDFSMRSEMKLQKEMFSLAKTGLTVSYSYAEPLFGYHAPYAFSRQANDSKIGVATSLRC